jgi:hypothetical protein
VQRGTSSDAQGSYDSALNEFKVWLLKTYPDEASVVCETVTSYSIKTRPGIDEFPSRMAQIVNQMVK